MKIQNDQCVFDADDVKLLSPLLQKALIIKGQQTTIQPEEVMTGCIGDCFEQSLSIFKASKTQEHADVIDALAVADDTIVAAVYQALGVVKK